MACAVPFVDCRGLKDSASHFKHTGEWVLQGKYSPPGTTSYSFNSSLSQIHPFLLCIFPSSSSPVSSFTFWVSLNLSLFPALAFQCPVPEFASPMISQIHYIFHSLFSNVFLHSLYESLPFPYYSTTERSPLDLSPLPFLSIFPDSSYWEADCCISTQPFLPSSPWLTGSMQINTWRIL